MTTDSDQVRRGNTLVTPGTHRVPRVTWSPHLTNGDKQYQDTITTSSTTATILLKTMSMSTERNIINVLVPATDGCDHVGRVSDVPVRYVLLMCTICDMLDNEANDMVTSYSDLLGL